MRKLPAKSVLKPLAVGTGLVALDVVVAQGRTDDPSHWAGGTCGNVLTLLSYLGWQAAPVARLQGGEAATQLLADLRRWGVSTDFISVGPDGSTPIIIHRIGQAASGEPRHTFSWRCPNCGSRLPGYKPVLATKAAQLEGQLHSPRVFFFDRLSRGALMLAKRCAELGAAIVFEPSSVGSLALFREAWDIADIVKYSHERLYELPPEFESRSGPGLQIETLGRDGLRYRIGERGRIAQKWQSLSALPIAQVRDTAGAGDWCTAGIVHKLFPAGARAIKIRHDARVRGALRYGQALAAWACKFEGARGGMYEVGRPQFAHEIAILLGKSGRAKSQAATSPIASQLAATCICPSCEQPRRRSRPRSTCEAA